MDMFHILLSGRRGGGPSRTTPYYIMFLQSYGGTGGPHQTYSQGYMNPVVYHHSPQACCFLFQNLSYQI